MLRKAGVLNWLPITLAFGLSLTYHYSLAADDSGDKIDAAVKSQSKTLASDPEQALQRAVDVARAGDNKRALAMLDALLKTHPDYYPARRDYIVVAAWDNQCELAWQRFQALKGTAQYEDYLVQPLSECLRDMRRYDDAKALLQKAKAKDPENEGINNARQDLQQALYWRQRPQLDVSLGASKSEQGAREWHVGTRYSHPLSPANRVYLRYLAKRATDPQFETGNMDRIGLGLQSWLSNDDLLDVEASTDARRGEEQSGRLEYTHLLDRRWEFTANYSSFSEDVPLRAKAQGVSANSAGLSAAFHTLDYRYEWSASLSRSHFSDTNTRNSAATGFGYAFELKPERELRVLLDYYQSDNSLNNVVYYNPEQESTLTLSLRADLVLDTKYERHVHHITLYVGNHEQRSYEDRSNYGARYAIDLEVSKRSAFYFAAQYGSNSYDGNNEFEGSLELTFSRKF